MRALGINKHFLRVWRQFFHVLPQSDSSSEGPVLRAYKAAAPGAAGDCGRWQRAVPARGQRWPRSQVLQGFLSLLRVAVVAVGVGPLATGLLDVHDPLRVGQTLLVAGEEAKPSGRKERSERPPLGAARSGFRGAGDKQQQTWREGSKSSQGVKEKVGGAGQSYSRKQQGVLRVTVTVPWR